MKKFVICVLLLCAVKNAISQIQTAGSYLNVTRPSGGPIQKGDILEIRAVIAVPGGTTVTLARFTDNVPTGTIYVPNSIKALTNEGVTVVGIVNTGNYTDAAGDDRAQYVSGAITVNIGDGATAAVGGTIDGTNTMPRHYNVACILMIAYRVTVDVYNGSSINLTGTFRYTSGTVQTIVLPANALKVAPLGACTSTLPANLMTAETNGTFSTGTTHSRSASVNITGFTYQNLGASNPGDGQYSITKNTSPTQYTGSTPAASDKVFGVIDIFGDHSGTSTGAGNPPAANGANRGYMAVVNASYAPAAVFNVPISGLLVNTSYTLSFWMRNICGTCGNDPTSNSGSGTPGVKPNLAFEMDGVDLYSTGEIPYTGQWVQKSFTFYTGASTSFVMTIKNNAPGGGGNDWAIDDILIQRCLVVLPVKMESFVASRKNDDVVLNWETSDEINFSYFTVERSLDGVSFTAIGNVAGGNITGKYQFTDNSHVSGTLHYRIRVTDRDDRATYTKTILISGGTGKNHVVVMPNPVRTTATLNIESTLKGAADITIFSLDGKRMFAQRNNLVIGANQVTVPGVNQLTNGIYMVQVTVGESKMITRMVVDK